MTFTLRDYQHKAHAEIVKLFRQSKKVLLVMATGSGKSKTAVSFIEKYKQHYIFILAVRTRDLVNQLEDDLELFNLDYGVFMAGHKKYYPSKPIQLCSIDTIHSRGVYPHRWSEKDVVLIIDEADQSKAEGYQELINVYCNRVNLSKPSYIDNVNLRNAFLLGMTATPYNGLDHFDEYIEPITPEELRVRGTLVEYEYIVPKCAIDLSEVRIAQGEYVQKDITSKLHSYEMIAECFKAWLEFGDNRQTLVFCINQDHAKEFTKYINSYFSSHVAEYVDSNTGEEVREEIYNRFRKGLLRFLVNVRIVTRGVNIIEIGTIVDCAPTLSVNHHVQKLGRGSRANPFYKNCIVIDPAKNCINNGHFYMKREINLKSESKRSKRDLENVFMKVCDICFRAFGIEVKNKCPFCNAALKAEPKKKLSKKSQEKLEMENCSPEVIEQKMMIKEFKKLLWIHINLDKKKSDIARRDVQFILLNKYGKDKVLKIKKTIQLHIETLEEWEQLHSYVPLNEYKF